MHAAIRIVLMALIVNTQFMNASPITAPSSVPRCQCNGHLSKTHKGLEIGECKYDGGKGLFCYVDADQSECCEDESSRYTKYCLSYSACGNQEWKPDKVQ